MQERISENTFTRSIHSIYAFTSDLVNSKYSLEVFVNCDSPMYRPPSVYTKAKLKAEHK